ncbi:MAG: hypothetical protein Roseis2KO_48500 [Roseivirga sp.]
MQQRDLPQRWQQKITAYLEQKGSGHESGLGAGDFPSNKAVRLKFRDDSYAEFRYTLVIEAPEFDEVGIFTEHCGYHIFSIYGTEISVVDIQES